MPLCKKRKSSFIQYSCATDFVTNHTLIYPTIICPIRYCNRGGDCHQVFLPHRECVCYDRCARCSVEFELDVNFDKVNPQRPDQERDLPLTVTSRDLVRCFIILGYHASYFNNPFRLPKMAHVKTKNPTQVSNNILVAPAHFLNEEEQDESHDEGISIVKLGPGQHLKLRAIARMGISKEHAKWCPVAVATYRFWPIITINEEACNMLTMEQKQELVEACPDRILDLDEITGNLVAVENAYEMATFTEDLKVAQEAMKKRPEDDDFVHVVQSTDKFVFSVESTGAMDAEDILLSSLRVLKDRLNYLASEVEKLKD